MKEKARVGVPFLYKLNVCFFSQPVGTRTGEDRNAGDHTFPPSIARQPEHGIITMSKQ